MYSIGFKNKNLSKFNRLLIVRNSLVIETNIIGYKSQGEAVLFFIYVDGIVGYTGLIDCYQTSDEERVLKILTEKNVKKLDFICWTHPDLDHSKGLKQIIESYADKDTIIWIPEGVDDYEIECSQEIQTLFSFLKNSMTEKNPKYTVYSASDTKNLLCYNSICFQHGMNQYPLSIMSYSPNSSRIRKQHYFDDFIKNERSIFCIIELGAVKLAMTGDIENPTIEQLPADIGGNHFHICKIPHHGSDTSTSFIGSCMDSADVACSTVFRMGKSNLPLDEVLEKYKQCSEFVFCTGKTNSAMENDKYGVLTVTTDVLNNTFDYRIEGNVEILKAI